ncbi:MAG: NADH-quinone oxidoreductase subunit J [Vicinamibacteraceae bacterium]
MIPLDVVLFYLFGGAAVACSLAVVAQRNPMHSVLLLIASFAALAGLYINLDSPFTAVTQIIVYAGAIMVLFLFVVMLLNTPREDVASPYGPAYVTLTSGPRKAYAVLSVILLVELALAVRQFVSTSAPSGPAAAAHVSSVKAIGIAIFTDYSLAFEATSVLILVAMVGAVVLAKKKL